MRDLFHAAAILAVLAMAAGAFVEYSREHYNECYGKKILGNKVTASLINSETVMKMKKVKSPSDELSLRTIGLDKSTVTTHQCSGYPGIFLNFPKGVKLFCQPSYSVLVKDSSFWGHLGASSSSEEAMLRRIAGQYYKLAIQFKTTIEHETDIVLIVPLYHSSEDDDAEGTTIESGTEPELRTELTLRTQPELRTQTEDRNIVVVDPDIPGPLIVDQNIQISFSWLEKVIEKGVWPIQQDERIYLDDTCKHYVTVPVIVSRGMAENWVALL